MADLTEAQKIYFSTNGELVIERKDGDVTSYQSAREIQASTYTGPALFKFGNNQFGAGSMVCTLAHGLSAQPSLIMITCAGSGSAAYDGASATHIRARLSATVANPVLFTWFAGR